MRMPGFFSVPSLLLLSTTLALAGCGDDAETTQMPTAATIWSRRIGRASSLEPVRIAATPDGGVVVTGRFYGTVDFGGGPVKSPGNNYQLYVAKYDAGGAHVWSHAYGDYLGETSGGIGVDAKGDVYVAAMYQGVIDFGDGPLQSRGQTDIALVKLDASGHHVWSKTFGDADTQQISSLAVNAGGEVALSGWFYGTLDFGKGPITAPDPQIALGFYVAKLDSAGEAVFAKSFDGGYYGYGGAIALDGAGNTLIGGLYGPTIDLGGGPLHASGEPDLFLGKLDPAGEHVWSKSFGGVGWDQATSIAVSAAGDAYLTGYISGTVDFGGGPLTGANDYDYDNDTFVLEVDTNGKYVFARRFVSEQYGGSATAVAAGASGGAVVTGSFYDKLDLGLGDMVSAGAEDGFVLALDGAGQSVWVRTWGNESPQDGSSVAVGASGAVYVGGSGLGDFDLGDGTKTGSGYYDQFVARLSPPAP